MWVGGHKNGVKGNLVERLCGQLQDLHIDGSPKISTFNQSMGIYLNRPSLLILFRCLGIIGEKWIIINVNFVFLNLK